MTCDEILSCLNPQQAEAVSTINGPVLVLAGAGTGKTRVITYRIAYMLSLGIPGENILGMTFTNKAATEMRDRLKALVGEDAASEVTLGTFHRFCGRLLRKEIVKLGYLPNFTIADESDQQGVLKQAMGFFDCNGEKFPAATVFAMISNWKNQLRFPDKAIVAAETQFESQAAHIYQKYQDILEMQNMIDFDDMLMLAWKVLNDYPDVLEKYRKKYRYLLVDEYQDTNAAQFALVKMLAGEERNLCVVGDDDQSIYSWRGADVTNILDFANYFPNTKTIRLEQNYRSTTAILDAANCAIHGDGKMRRHEKKLWSDISQGNPPQVICLQDGEDEANFIANLVNQMHKEENRKYSDFAVLFRSNQLSRQLEQSFRQSAIPYKIFGGQQFYQRREIKDAIAYLRILVNPKDDQSLLRALVAPPRGIGPKAIGEMKQQRTDNNAPMLKTLASPEFQNTMTKAGKNGTQELMSAIEYGKQLFSAPGELATKITMYLKKVGYIGGLQKIYRDIADTEKRLDNIDEFISSVTQFEKRNSQPATLEQCLESFALLEDSERAEEKNNGADSVTFSTVHAAKGLEFPIVFVVAMENGIFPHERALQEGSSDEERRLFYVAITRAKQELFLLHAKFRMVKGVTKTALPSPFIKGLPSEIAKRTKPKDVLHEATPEEIKEAFAEIFKMLK